MFTTRKQIRTPFLSSTMALALAFTFASTVRLSAAAPSDPLTLLPANSAAIGHINIHDLKDSPLTREIFKGLDQITTDGDAAKFLSDAGLNPATDFDAVTIGAAPKLENGNEAVVVVVEGHFDPERLARAATARGAILKNAGGHSYYLLPEHQAPASAAAPHHDHSGAVAFLDNHMIVAGEEGAVAAALAGDGHRPALYEKQSGAITGTPTGWLLLDAARFGGGKARAADTGHERRPSVEGNHPEQQIASLARSVTFFAAQFSVERSRVSFSGHLHAADAQSRQDLEDVTRGLLAAWRMSMQEKNPDWVAVIRGFKVSQNDEGLIVSGIIPGAMIEKWHAEAKANQQAEKRKAPVIAK